MEGGEWPDDRASAQKVHVAVQQPVRMPWWCWPLLCAAVVAVSSAAAVFKVMGDVPALTLAAWRLQLTALLLAPPALWQYSQLTAEAKADTRRSAGWLSASGACLAAHFGLWVWSLEHTSLPHSLLLVSTAPIILTAVALVLRQPISHGEVGGAALAVAGSVMLACGAASGSEQESTLLGDAAAFGAAVAVVGYLQVGRHLRTWMPIFVYACPVTALAAALLTAGGLALDGGGLVGGDRHGVLGWLASARYAPWVVYLALGPGLVGHTGFNTLLKHMTPLMVGLATTLEPVIGPVIGYGLGVMTPPGPWTYAGGAVVLAATALVTWATSQREQRERDKQAGAMMLDRVFSDSELGHLMGGGAEADLLESVGLLGSDEEEAEARLRLGLGEGFSKREQRELSAMDWQRDNGG